MANTPSQSLGSNTGDDVTLGLLEECKSLGSLCPAGGKPRPLRAARELMSTAQDTNSGAQTQECTARTEEVYITVRIQTGIGSGGSQFEVLLS